MDEALLLTAARRAYELSRVRLGLRRAALAAPLAALALYHCIQAGRAAATAVGITAFAALVALFTWRGEGYGRGVRTGIAAGIGPLLLPLLARWTGLLCSATVCEVLPAAAVLGGCLGGLALAGGSLVRERRGWEFWFSAVAVTVTLGSVGCLHAGLAGLGGMALGLLAGTLTPLALRAVTAR
jgi:hypothetical protein